MRLLYLKLVALFMKLYYIYERVMELNNSYAQYAYY